MTETAISGWRRSQIDLFTKGTMFQQHRARARAMHVFAIIFISIFTLGQYVSFRFFAGENVPSPIVSSQLTCFSPWSFPSRRAHALENTPDSLHSFSRRQQVLGDGKCIGKSCQRAPVLSTQRTLSRQGRGSMRGRPPRRVMGGCGNRLAIKSHCSSLSCDLGSVLDPVRLRPRRGQHNRVSFMRVPPFTRTGMQIACQTAQ